MSCGCGEVRGRLRRGNLHGRWNAAAGRGAPASLVELNRLFGPVIEIEDLKFEIVGAGEGGFEFRNLRFEIGALLDAIRECVRF
jgi:hypothetical protein